MATELDFLRIGFIGAGRMATALARGWLSAGLTSAEKIVASDPLSEARKQFTAQTGAEVVDTNAEVLTHAAIVILSVKPQQMQDVLDDIQNHVTSNHLMVSIAAGVSLKTLSGSLGEESRIIRVMPNTPCLVGASAAAFSVGGTATEEDSALVERMLSLVGIAVPVAEHLLDAVTGLSGSGPAFVYQIIEALSDGGVMVGLPRDIALKLATQTVLGAAKMVLETGEHPAALKDAVASPGGTTIAGLHALEQGGLRSCLINAVEAATRRSRELGHAS
jgi:pyrroline-5-carboxylate reductase